MLKEANQQINPKLAEMANNGAFSQIYRFQKKRSYIIINSNLCFEQLEEVEDRIVGTAAIIEVTEEEVVVASIEDFDSSVPCRNFLLIAYHCCYVCNYHFL